MNKDTLVLKDGTEILLESTQGIGALRVAVENKAKAAELWEKFTGKNLELILIKNGDGETTGRYEEMVLDHVTGTEVDGKVIITFSIRHKTKEEMLEERVAELEAGQQTQDSAISDLGQAVSDIAEGGAQ